MAQFNNTVDSLTQSDYLYLQAAGSPGNTDGSAAGIHLRWSLRGTLGDQHLPKGNLSASGTYATNIGFNKSNDFVKIYRRPKPLSPVSFAMNTLGSGNIQDSGTSKEWIFQNGSTVLTVRFTDSNEYNVLKAKYDLNSNPSTASNNVLNDYKGVIELHVNKLFFGINFNIGDSPNASTFFRVEGISQGREGNTSQVISHRREISLSQTTLSYEFFEENLDYVRFANLESPSLSIDIYTYEAEIYGPNWTSVGQYSLSDLDADAYERLEDSSRFTLNNWPKYNDGSTVVKNNYKNRWDANNGIQAAVQDYLTLSKTDVLATKVYGQNNPANSGGNDDDAKIEVSVLDILKLMAMDYHIARMLGLGHIDTPASDEYIYLAHYVTQDPLETGGAAGTKEHFFMSLPVSEQTERLPVTPAQDNLEFGLYYDQGQGQRTYITDQQGYALTEDKRYVRVNLVNNPFPKSIEPFFADNTTIETSKYTRPVAYGVEYKNSGASSWVSPELSHDEENPDNLANTPYLDNNGAEETEMIFFSGSNPLYLHSEVSQGTHIYAIYGINWFSRASALSNTKSETTSFPNRLKLLPPLDIKPQLIQRENPLIFTTSDEQDLYNNIQGSDETLLRLQFVIDHRHNIAHKDANKVQFFFRENPTNIVEGKVKSVVDLSPVTCRLRTESYNKASVNMVIMPFIPNGQESHYVGSFLIVDNEQFEILAVQQSGVSGEGPIFDLAKIKDNSIVATGTAQQAISSQYLSPKAGKKFTASENLLNPNRWNQLSKEISIIKYSSHKETTYLADGTERILDIGGVFEKASIQADTNAGFYNIIFSSYNLPAHPDAAVKWRGGIVRIASASDPNRLKELEVVQIDTTSNLQLKVYDGTPSDLITTGTNIDVNFFPGYMVYLYAETGFGETETLPGLGEMTKMTYIATRTRDSVLDVNSYISPAKPIIAREIIDPKTPLPPKGNSFATRPDFYGKATYTFDTLVDTVGGRQPFSLVFYRANTEGLLRALYKESTYQSLRAQLETLEDDPYYNNFWIDLINMVLVTGQFKVYPGSSFQFPNPDRVYDQSASEFDVSKNPGMNQKYQDKVRDKLMNAFVPLTADPVLYLYLQAGKVTSPKKPNIRDAYGNILPPSSPGFDQAPMAAKFSDSEGSKVRFTDYNLDGASQDLYFYTARELSNDYRFSEFSAVFEPIRILNTMPFSAPVIKNIESVAANPSNGTVPAVSFEIGEYDDALNVTHVKIYRSLTPEDAKSVRTMQLANTNGPLPLSGTIEDDFSDLSNGIPFNEPLFYRLVACKTILNENGSNELIDSLPSEILLSNVIDNTVPLAPEITATYSGPSGAPAELTGVVLSWDKVVHNARYILYKMNSSGNWNKIHDISGDNSAQLSVDLATTDLGDNNLTIVDDQGNAIYHHFKVEVINASGLSSRNDEILTLGEEIASTGFSGFPTIIDRVNIVVDENAKLITKSGPYGWNAGGFSEEYIGAGQDGYVEREIGGTLSDNVRVFCGLSYTNGGPDKASINYGIESGTNDDVRIEVNGSYSGAGPDYQLGDILKVERLGDDINFYLNSAKIHTVSESTVNPSMAGDALYVDFSMANDGKKLYNLFLQAAGSNPPPPPPPSGFSGFPTIINDVDIIIDTGAELITKSGSYGWNAGGFSQESIPLNGDGYVIRTIDGSLSDNVRVCCGLSYSDGGADKASIDYAIESGTNDDVRVEVNGNFATTASDYQIGDTLKVERVGNTINFYLNSSVIHTVSELSANPSNAGNPLFVDFSMANNGKKLFGLKLITP